MLSEKEKRAIEELKKVRWNSLAIVVKNEDGKMDISYFTEKHKKTLLNLIENQQKEIEELKEDNKHQWKERCKLTFELENSTSNDKIKAKIERYNEWIKKGGDYVESLEAQRYALQELLEED